MFFQADNGYLASTGEFQVSCEYDEWVMPPFGWPDPAHCVAASDCDLTNVTATPSHLTRTGARFKRKDFSFRIEIPF